MVEKLIEILEHSNLFLTGGAGVGKSYSVREVISHYQKNGKVVIRLGSTGISAVNIGGVTLHSFFNFGICKDYEELKEHDKRRKPKIRELNMKLELASLIVIDEISLVSAVVFDMIYYRLINSRFNGKIMVVGDFYQLSPIQKEPKGGLLFSGIYAFSSYAWGLMKFINVELTTSKRTNDANFYSVLSNIRVGEVGDRESGYLEQFLGVSFEKEYGLITLFGRNKEADELNKIMLDGLKSKPLANFGEIRIMDNTLSSDRVEKWARGLNALDVFEFKVGAKVIFTVNKFKNSFIQSGYFNGEQGIIIGVNEDENGISNIVVKKFDGEIVYVEKNSYDLGEFVMVDGELSYMVLASFYQFPLRLAYGITIHKSQGMGISRLECNLDHIFADGQLYVALSRAIDPKNLKITYTRKEPFASYIARQTRVSNDVKEFYESEKFIKFS